MSSDCCRRSSVPLQSLRSAPTRPIPAAASHRTDSAAAKRKARNNGRRVRRAISSRRFAEPASSSCTFRSPQPCATLRDMKQILDSGIFICFVSAGRQGKLYPGAFFDCKKDMGRGVLRSFYPLSAAVVRGGGRFKQCLPGRRKRGLPAPRHTGRVPSPLLLPVSAALQPWGGQRLQWPRCARAAAPGRRHFPRHL